MEAVYQQKYLKYKAKYTNLHGGKWKTRPVVHAGGTGDWDEMEGGAWYNPFAKALTPDEINKKVADATTAYNTAVTAVGTAIAALQAAFTPEYVRGLFGSQDIIAPFLNVANSVAGLNPRAVIGAPSSTIADKYATGSTANAFNNGALNAVSLLATSGTTKINETIRTNLNKLLNDINDKTEAARKAQKVLTDATVEQTKSNAKQGNFQNQPPAQNF